MGLLGRSKSLRRKQSELTSSKSSDERPPTKMVDRRPSEVRVAQQQVQDGRSRVMMDMNNPYQHTIRRPSATSQLWDKPLPTPDEELPRPKYPQSSHTQIIEVTSDSHVFRFPTPSPTTPTKPSPARPSQDATIGIALGSPRLQPPQYLSKSSQARAPASPLRTLSEPLKTPATAIPPLTPSHASERPKLQKQSSRSFRNMFGRPAPKQAETRSRTADAAAYRTMTSSSNSHTNSQNESKLSLSNGLTPIQSIDSSVSAVSSSRIQSQEKSHLRAESRGKSVKKSQPVVSTDNRSISNHPYTASAASEATKSRPTITPAPASFSLTPKPLKYKPIIIPQMNQDALNRINYGRGEPAPAPSKDAAKDTMLQVDIPKSEMERYSVMFEKLLKPRESIAERRGTLKRLKPLGEIEEGATPSPLLNPGTPRRRATSPSMPSRPSPSPRSKEIVEQSIQAVNKAHEDAANQLMQMRRARTAPVQQSKFQANLDPLQTQNLQPPSRHTRSAQPDPLRSSPPRPNPLSTQRLAPDAHHAAATRSAPTRSAPTIIEPALQSSSPTSTAWSEASLPVTPPSATPDSANAAHTFLHLDSEDPFTTVRKTPPRTTILPTPITDRKDDRPDPQRTDSLEPEDTNARARKDSVGAGNAAVRARQGAVGQGVRAVAVGQMGVARSISVSRAKTSRVPVVAKQPLRAVVVGGGEKRVSTRGAIEEV